MIDWIPKWIVALAQIVMAVGVIRFWITWFRTEHNEPWQPPGFIEHERTFVYPDTVMSILMIIAAFLLLFNSPYGPRLTLVCGGMMLFLTIIDLAYFLQNDLFSRDKMGKEAWGLILPMVGMSFLMIFRFV